MIIYVNDRERHFNPRSLTGATFLFFFWFFCYIIFQSTLPHGSDDKPPVDRVIAVQFQSTLPHGSDLRSPYSPQQRKHFNPRSLTGATALLERAPPMRDISIHAPSRERLQAILSYIPSRFISIHAPSRERLKIFEPRNSVITFQSTLPHGSDYYLMDKEQLHRFISIHAPSRERHRFCR